MSNFCAYNSNFSSNQNTNMLSRQMLEFYAAAPASKGASSSTGAKSASSSTGAKSAATCPSGQEMKNGKCVAKK